MSNEIVLEEKTYRNQHVPRIRGEVNDGIGWAGIVWSLIALEVVMTCQGVETLPTIRQISLQSEDAGIFVGEFCEIDVEDLVALLEEVRDAVSTGFS